MENVVLPFCSRLFADFRAPAVHARTESFDHGGHFSGLIRAMVVVLRDLDGFLSQHVGDSAIIETALGKDRRDHVTKALEGQSSANRSVRL